MKTNRINMVNFTCKANDKGFRGWDNIITLGRLLVDDTYV